MHNLIPPWFQRPPTPEPEPVLPVNYTIEQNGVGEFRFVYSDMFVSSSRYRSRRDAVMAAISDDHILSKVLARNTWRKV